MSDLASEEITENLGFLGPSKIFARTNVSPSRSPSIESMNCISSMNPLHHTDELLFQTSISHRPRTIHQDMLIVVPPSDGRRDPPIKVDKSRARKSPNTPDSNDGSGIDHKKKMITRREVERQRRQDMASLYTSLRSLVPFEYLKGKRSTCDLMNESANYIKYLEKKIQELGDKRNGLKILSKPPDIGRGNLGLPGCVMVQPCWAGVEVVISSSLRDGVLPLSRVLEVLVEEGFGVVSCVSTRVNERSLHTIQSEVSDLSSVNISGLQQKLTDLIQTSSRIPV